MNITSGKHAGKISEQLVLKWPDYVEWYRQNHATAALGREFTRLVGKMDSKPFVVKCHGCSNVATRASAYDNHPGLYFWCDSCNPYTSGANPGKLNVITTYDDALAHIYHTAGGHTPWKRSIIKSLAQAKGLPARVGDAQAIAFF